MTNTLQLATNASSQPHHWSIWLLLLIGILLTAHGCYKLGYAYGEHAWNKHNKQP